MKPTLTLLVAMLVAGGAHASEVFKTTDSKGQPVYTDRPATLPAERLDVRTQTTDKVEVQQRYDEQMRNYAATEQAQAKQNAAAKDAAAADGDERARFEAQANLAAMIPPAGPEARAPHHARN